MKNRVSLAFLTLVFLLMTVGCKGEPSAVVTTTTSYEMTTTTTETQHTTSVVPLSGIGGDDWHYTRCYVLEFSIESALRNLVNREAYEEWWNTFECRGGNRSDYEFNVYELITEFGITRQQVEDLCQDIYEKFNGELYFTEEQIEVLFTGTREEVYSYFTYPTALFVAPGDKVYSAKWLSEHTAKEYWEAGITPDLLEAYFLKTANVSVAPGTKEYVKAQQEALQALPSSTVDTAATTVSASK